MIASGFDRKRILVGIVRRTSSSSSPFFPIKGIVNQLFLDEEGRLNAAPFFRPLVYIRTYMIRTGRATRYGATSAYIQRTHRGKDYRGIRSVFFPLHIYRD